MIDADTKAAAIAECIAGGSYRSVAQKYGISRSSLQEWVKKARNEYGEVITNSDRAFKKAEQTNVAIHELAQKVLNALGAQADLLADKEFIRERPLAEIERHTRYVDETVWRYIEFAKQASKAGKPELPESGYEEAAVPGGDGADEPKE